jgi:hypothetical protein
MPTLDELNQKIKELCAEKRILELEKEIEQLKKEIDRIKGQQTIVYPITYPPMPITPTAPWPPWGPIIYCSDPSSTTHWTLSVSGNATP